MIGGSGEVRKKVGAEHDALLQSSKARLCAAALPDVASRRVRISDFAWGICKIKCGSGLACLAHTILDSGLPALPPNFMLD